MSNSHLNRHVTDEERRDFLKALGVSGAVAAGSATLGDVRDAVSAESTDKLAPIGQSIQSDLAGELNADLLASQQATFTEAASALPAVLEKGLPGDEPRDEFKNVAEAGRPVYSHLAEVGFFESTTEHLPEFTPNYLEESVKAFVGSEALAAPLVDLGFLGEDAIDLVATVVANAQRISDRHWIATDEISRTEIELGEFIPPMTLAAAGGVLLWLEEIDKHLWQKKVLITDNILADAVWHARAMGAGFQLMTEGAKTIAKGSSTLSNAQLAALLSSGFALQAISQSLLTEDVFWINEEMRAH